MYVSRFFLIVETRQGNKSMGDLSQSVLIIFNGLLNWEIFISQPLFLSHKFKYPEGRVLFSCH